MSAAQKTQNAMEGVFNNFREKVLVTAVHIHVHVHQDMFLKELLWVRLYERFITHPV